MCLGEVESVVENLHLVFDFGLLGCGLVDGLLEVFVEVADGYGAELDVFTAYAENLHQGLGEPGGEERDGIEDEIERGRERCHHAHRAVGVDAEYGFGEELAGEQDDAGGDERLADEHEGLVGVDTFEPRLDHLGGAHAVDHEHDVVAHQDGGDEEFRPGVEYVKYSADEASLLDVELHAHAVGGDEGYLDAREEGGECQGDDCDYEPGSVDHC